MLDLCAVTSGSRVLDVAAGAGDQSLIAAERVGPGGYVLATDISSKILEFAAQNARSAGVTQLDTRVLDGENLDVPPRSFDAVISRVGLIYFPDQHKALTGMLQALRPGGRVGAIVYSTADKNPFFSVPVSIIRKWASLPPPAPGQPGPFSLGAPGVLENAFARAGFRDVLTERIEAPLTLPSAAECVRFERESFGALHAMMAGLDVEKKDAVWSEILTRLKEFESSGGFSGPCELVVAVGTRPDS
jgi:SAM-dependent methyltransferase